MVTHVIFYEKNSPFGETLPCVTYLIQLSTNIIFTSFTERSCFETIKTKMPAIASGIVKPYLVSIILLVMRYIPSYNNI